MHFHEYLLLEVQTVSQYLKSGKIPEAVIKEAKIAAKVTINSTTVTNALNTPAGRRVTPVLINWVTYNSIKEYYKNNTFDTSNPGAASFAASRIGGWTRNFVIGMWQQMGDYIASHTNDQQLLAKLNTIDYSLENLKADNHAWHDRLKLQKAVPGAPGKIIIKLDDVGMPGWTWVSLGKGYCSVEAQAGGHCGNSGTRDGDNIISLRDPQQKVHLTFIVNNKVLGESKGRFNQKPAKQYHKAITKLLLSSYVNTIKGGGYEPKMNFHFDDLTPEEQKLILKKKPHMASYVNYVFGKKIDKAKIDNLFGTSIVGIKGQEVTLENFDDLKELYDQIKSNQVDDFSWLDDPTNFLDNYSISDKEIIDDIISYLNQDEINILLKILASTGTNISEYDNDLGDILSNEDSDVIEDVKDAIRWAANDAFGAAAEEDAYKDVRESLSSITENGFYVDMNNGISVKIQLHSLKQLYQEHADEFEGGESISTYYDFKYSAPYNGYSGFSEYTLHESLSSRIYDLKQQYNIKN